MADKQIKSITFPDLPDRYTFLQSDTTLTQSGKAADAKVVGDMITGLEGDISQTKEEGTVPTSEQMLSENVTVDSVPYHFRKTASDNADREELEIVGGSVAWNQLNSDTSEFAVAGGENKTYQSSVFSVVSGHKYLFLITQSVALTSATRNRFGINVGSSSTYANSDSLSAGVKGWVYLADSSNDAKMLFWCHTPNTDVTFSKAMAFDLTQMFGSTIADHIYALEQATAGAGVVLFKSLFPKDYYAYDSGSMQSVSGLSAHKTTGFNQWDEEWKAGHMTAGQEVSDGTYRLISKNYIRVVSGKEYCFATKAISQGVTIYGYNSEKEYVSFLLDSNRTNDKISVVSIPNGVSYIKFQMYAGYGQTASLTYNHDICINISDPAKNGQYEPYSKHSYPLNPNGDLRGVPTLVDGKIKFDGDIYSPSGKVERRYALEVFDGTDSTGWGFVTSYGTVARFDKTISSLKIDSGAHLLTNMFVRGAIGTADLECCNVHDGSHLLQIQISESKISGSPVQGLMAYFAEHPLVVVYELTTPTTETADSYVSPQICHHDGTEEFVSTGIVPVGHNTKYPDNMRAKLDGLPWNFASLIAPTESGFKATRNYTTGQLLIVNNVLYKATANIANGGTITPNTNVTATTLAEIIAALA